MVKRHLVLLLLEMLELDLLLLLKLLELMLLLQLKHLLLLLKRCQTLSGVDSLLGLILGCMVGSNNAHQLGILRVGLFRSTSSMHTPDGLQRDRDETTSWLTSPLKHHLPGGLFLFCL